MKIEKYTPGPWGVSSENSTIIKAFDAFGETDIIIGSATGYSGSPFFPSDEVATFNVQLMAAAPQLAYALKAIFDDYKRLADSGDAGNWALEETEVGKQAIAALTAVGAA